MIGVADIFRNLGNIGSWITVLVMLVVIFLLLRRLRKRHRHTRHTIIKKITNRKPNSKKGKDYLDNPTKWSI